jgi:hypothetical protein
MWPVTTLSFHDETATPLARAEGLCDVICAEPLPAWRWPATEVAAALLADAARDLFDRHPVTQAEHLAAAARRHGVHPKTAWDLATGVGSTVAQTTHRNAEGVGVPALNALAASAIEPATELFFARERLRLAQELSDADLPRLLMLANGLTHGVPPDIMRRVPGRSSGPIAQVIPVHDDLVGWTGIRPAVEHLRDVTRAAVEGRRWLATALDESVDDRLLALGIVGLTRPATALQLALVGPARLTLADFRDAAGPPPGGVLDLSDPALKAVCDRNGWLLGNAAERTQRELVDRAGPSVAPHELRAMLAAGAPDAFDPLHAAAPDDRTLDGRAFRKNPPSPGVVAAHSLLGEAGREALREFAGVEPPHRSTVAEALAHRFPERRGREVLCEPEAARIMAAELPAKRLPAAVPQTLDLGL